MSFDPLEANKKIPGQRTEGLVISLLSSQRKDYKVPVLKAVHFNSRRVSKALSDYLVFV